MSSDKDLDAAIDEHSNAPIGRGPSWDRWSDDIMLAVNRIIERNDDPEDRVQISAAGAAKIIKNLFDFTVSENTLRNYAKKHLKRKAWAEP